MFWDEKTPGTGACIKEMLENQKLRGTRSSWLKRGAAKGDGVAVRRVPQAPKGAPMEELTGEEVSFKPYVQVPSPETSQQ